MAKRETATMDDVLVLKTWFENDVPYGIWNDNVKIRKQLSEITPEGYSNYEYSLELYTDTNQYHIDASIRQEKDGSFRDYLGCIASSRKPRAGEDWTRGNDLPDGPLTKETWRAILGAIVGYELVKIHSRKQSKPVPEIPTE